jgi:hypothetical protein
MKKPFLIATLTFTLASIGPVAVAEDCFNNGYDAGRASCQVCETCETCPTPPNCQEGDYDRGVASVKLPNCQEGDYDRGVASVKLPNCQEGDYGRGMVAGQATCQICPTYPTPPNCQEGDYEKGINEGREMGYQEGLEMGRQECPIIDCQEGEYDRGYEAGFQAGQADIQRCLADASQCTGQLKAIYEAGQQSVKQNDDCETHPENCVISSLQVFYDYFIQYRGTIGQLNFTTGLVVPPLGGRDGPAYEFRQSCLDQGDGTCLIQKTSGNGDIDQSLGWNESLGYVVDLVPWWDSSVKEGEMEIVFRLW